MFTLASLSHVSCVRVSCLCVRFLRVRRLLFSSWRLFPLRGLSCSCVLFVLLLVVLFLLLFSPAGAFVFLCVVVCSPGGLQSGGAGASGYRVGFWGSKHLSLRITIEDPST